MQFTQRRQQWQMPHFFITKCSSRNIDRHGVPCIINLNQLHGLQRGEQRSLLPLDEQPHNTRQRDLGAVK